MDSKFISVFEETLQDTESFLKLDGNEAGEGEREREKELMQQLQHVICKKKWMSEDIE